VHARQALRQGLAFFSINTYMEMSESSPIMREPRGDSRCGSFAVSDRDGIVREIVDFTKVWRNAIIRGDRTYI
jgi:hypothetical protein